MKKEDISEKIIEMEEFACDSRHRNGVSVEVRNLRIYKRKNLIIADILIFDDGNQSMERFNSCEYPLDQFYVILNWKY